MRLYLIVFTVVQMSQSRKNISHKTWLHKNHLLSSVTRIYFPWYFFQFTPNAWPSNTHSSLSVSAPLSFIAELRVESHGLHTLPCTKPDQVNTLFPRIASSSSLFAQVTKERELRRDLATNLDTINVCCCSWLLHHTQHLASPVYPGPSPVRTRTLDTNPGGCFGLHFYKAWTFSIEQYLFRSLNVSLVSSRK